MEYVTTSAIAQTAGTTNEAVLMAVHRGLLPSRLWHSRQRLVERAAALAWLEKRKTEKRGRPPKGRD